MGKMSDEIKKQRLAKLMGIEYEPPTPISPKERERQTLASREAEATILYFEDRSKFIERMCRICERVFAVNRQHIAFCSDPCRAVHMREEVGITDWDPTGRSPEERWSYQTGGREPLIVPPAALLRLKENTPDPIEIDQVVESETPLLADSLLG